jgi:hypothetical protein
MSAGKVLFIAEVTTIWSQKELLTLMAAKSPNVLDRVKQDGSWLALERSINGNWYLKSGFIIVFEFNFANFRGRVDAPQGEIQLDETTKQYKYKLHIANVGGLLEDDFEQIEGHPPPEGFSQPGW